MKKTLLIDIIAYFFILLFLYTGVTKLMEIHLFREQLISNPIIKWPFLATVITWALPIGELLLAIALFIPKTQFKALCLTLAIMILFTIYVTILYLVDNQLSCSCGGVIEELPPRQHIIFNSACTALCLIAILKSRRIRVTPRFLWLTNTAALSLLVVIGWFLFTAFSVPLTPKTGLEGRKLPSFDLLLVDSTTHMNTADIPSGRPIIIIGFSPWCVHCQAETRDIIKHIPQFGNARIYYISTFPLNDMKVFYNAFKLSRYPNISMGKDLNDYFFPYFKTHGVPYTAVYDTQKRLKQVLQGEAKAETLARLADQN